MQSKFMMIAIVKSHGFMAATSMKLDGKHEWDNGESWQEMAEYFRCYQK